MMRKSLAAMLVRGAVGAFALAVVTVLLGAGAGCKERGAPSGKSPVRLDVYVVRGQIVQLPDPGDARREFQVRHEPIPHFRGQGGELGMDTMTMPFPLGPGLALDGLSPGDVVELKFEVEFDPAADRLLGYRATSVTKLPAETPLDFTPMARPEASPPAQPSK